MSKAMVKLQRVCATDANGRAPVIESLQAVLKTDLPARTFYWLSKIGVLLEKEFAEYEAARIKVVVKFGVQQEDKRYQIPPDKWDDFAAEIKTLERDLELPLEAGTKLILPPTINGEAWLPLIMALDIFEEPK